jgi:endonuclease G
VASFVVRLSILEEVQMRKLICGAWMLGLVVTLVLSQGHICQADDNMLMGNPSEARHDEILRNNYLMEKPYFSLSYNNSTGTPNWVSWHLTHATIGNKPRPRKFLEDLTLPPSFVRVTSEDYINSGFDRGHMCPHSDRDKTDEENQSTFIMTNIVPQSGPNNQGAWDALEVYSRHLVEKKGKELYIISGPSGMRGEGKAGRKNKIGNGKIVVPHSTWKVIMVLDADDTQSDLNRVNEETRLIAVIIPNDMGVDKTHWGQYRHSVSEVEELTGLTFFSKVTNKLGAAKDHLDDERVPVFHLTHGYGE